MKRKLAISILLILSIITFCFSFQRKLTTYNFNEQKVKDNISYLSSDTFDGRMAGTFSNEMAAAYIRNQFEKSKLTPFVSDYYETFNVTYPKRIAGSPYLRVLNAQGQTIKDFTYNKEFKEDMLSFNQNHVVFNKNSIINYDNNYIKISNGIYNYILYVPSDNKLQFRSSFDHSSKISLLVTVTSETLKDIKTYLNKQASIDCFIPYTESDTNINNVVGYIKGADSKLPPIVISAHFDHMGVDFANNIYPGALDNASGISFVLEMSKYIKSLGTPDRDVIFAAFNAEEFGLLGSDTFAKKFSSRLTGGKVFNFDMIGSNNSVPLSLMGAKTDSSNTPFIHTMAAICTNDHINFNYNFEDASDHSSFRKLGIDAITFSDSDVTRIHTPNDKAEYISTNSIKRCYTVASEEIVGLAYKNNFWIIYNKQIWISSLACSLVFSITLIYLIRKLRTNDIS